jgi:alpha-D-ribose 1-methylphosphonate 5-triphosphate synthase subunit PhnH
MHPAMDGSPALASVGQRSQEVAVYLDAALGPERAAIAMHIDAWASLVETASAAQLAVVPLITADELARLCHSDRSPVVLVYDTRSTCLDVAVADLHAAGAERVITGPALVVAAHLLALARLLTHSGFRAADKSAAPIWSAPIEGDCRVVR